MLNRLWELDNTVFAMSKHSSVHQWHIIIFLTSPTFDIEAPLHQSHHRLWGWRRSPCSPPGTWCTRRCMWPRQRGAARRRWWWCPPESASAASQHRSWTQRGPCMAAPQTRPARDWRWPHSAWCHSPASARSPWWRRMDGKSRCALERDGHNICLLTDLTFKHYDFIF